MPKAVPIFKNFLPLSGYIQYFLIISISISFPDRPGPILDAGFMVRVTLVLIFVFNKNGETFFWLF